MSNTNFVHLHCHTEYSLLDGLSKVDKLVKRVKELEMPAIAMTDHGVMYGAIEFYKECQKQGVKPLIGLEGYIINRDHKLREGKGENNHLVLLAKNLKGYQNLMRLSTIAHLEGFYYKPRFDKETLRKHSEGLICTSACPKGEVSQQIVAGNMEAAQKTIEWYVDTFGQENYFLEVQRHFYRDHWDKIKDNQKLVDKLKNMQASEDVWVDGVVKLSRKLGVPIVATNDAHYIRQTDATAQDALVCISTGKTVPEIERLRYIDTPTFFVKTAEEMAADFPDLPDALSNTVKVAEMSDVTIELGKWYFPNIDLPEGKTAPEALAELANDRVKEKYPEQSEEVKTRLAYELDIIISKGYAPYFLMMADMVNWCTDQGIITNTRGSAAGSIVSYVIGITTIDPVRYMLPFERFLNPFRPKPPDIDLDIADDRRHELIAYIVNKYGAEKVAQICTFGRMLAKASVRDVGRALGHPYAFPDKISKLIPLGSQGFPMTIQKALDLSPELKVMYDSDSAAKQLIDLAMQMEGNARHSSVHAAGIVVSPTEMTNYTPLQFEPNGEKIITQYEMHACEDVGLVKFDILGIRNLSILGAARDLIEAQRNIKIDLTSLPNDDKKTYEMLARGETMGVFQLGGSGMTKWLKELKPTRVEDIMIMIALFRPGPMANIPEFIARKNKRSQVGYLHPKMKNFLSTSFGILVYQEDILYTALELAGYDWGSVDALRQAIGKKKPKEMAEQHEIFVEGCIKTSGMTKPEAEKLWDLFVPFQGYGFNKAHAASYGFVSYQTGYLKANYPVEYMTALLTAEAGDTEKVVEAMDECKRMKIAVLTPDINESDSSFKVELNEKSLDGRAIRFGFSGIKNVGEVAIKIILEERKQGKYLSFTDFCLRVDSQKVNRKVLESLIKAGAMDVFGKRSAMLAALDKIRELGLSISKLKNSGQTDLFGGEEQDVDHKDNLPDIEEFEKAQKLGMEKELLGFYLTEHPHADRMQELTNHISHKISDLYSENFAAKRVVIGGIVESVRNVVTKANNQQMCFAKISDLTKTVDVVVFPKVYAVSQDCWKQDNLVLISGKIEDREAKGTENEEDAFENRELTILAESAVMFTGAGTKLSQPPPPPDYTRFASHKPRNPAADKPISEEAVPAKPKPITISIPKGLPSNKLVALNTLLQDNKGDTPASLEFLNGSSAKILPLPYGLNWGDALRAEIDQVLSSS